MPGLKRKHEDCGFAADGCIAPLRKTPDHNGIVFWMGVERKIWAPTQRGEAHADKNELFSDN